MCNVLLATRKGFTLNDQSQGVTLQEQRTMQDTTYSKRVCYAEPRPSQWHKSLQFIVGVLTVIWGNSRKANPCQTKALKITCAAGNRGLGTWGPITGPFWCCVVTVAVLDDGVLFGGKPGRISGMLQDNTKQRMIFNEMARLKICQSKFLLSVVLIMFHYWYRASK